jgi:hypothetical protein
LQIYGKENGIKRLKGCDDSGCDESKQKNFPGEF